MYMKEPFHNSGVSVIICCYNSKDVLPETLRHLSLQQVDPNLRWEIILVDNASADNTSEVARSVWEKFQSTIPLCIVHEAVPGKTAALKKGYQLAKYEFVLICDDDNWLSANYIQNAYNLISVDETIGALGGKGIPVCEQPLPWWFDERFSPCYAVGPQSVNGPPEKRWLYGAGMVLRKRVFDKISEMSLEYQLSCRKGDGKKGILGGGDTELCFILTLLNYQILYNEKLLFRHFITGSRLNFGYLKRLHIGYGLTVPLLSTYEELVKSKTLKTKVNAYFWIPNFFAALKNSTLDLCSLAARLILRRKVLDKQMDFIY